MHLSIFSLAYSRNVNAFLQQHRSASLHKKIVKNFDRRQWLVPAMFHTISCDLIGQLCFKRSLISTFSLDYRKYSRVNHGYNYILCIIDCFSRFAWAAPLKTKTLQETAEAFNTIISSMNIVPRIFRYFMCINLTLKLSQF